MKLFGAIIIMLCCGWFGISLASGHKREENHLRQLLSALEYMQCELQYRLTPLPELCLKTANSTGNGPIRHFFLVLSQELSQQISAQVLPCVNAALDKTQGLSKTVQACIAYIGQSLGTFDYDGQISALRSSATFCRECLDKHCEGKEDQRRSYQTLAVCAGAALVIILV